MLKEKEEFQPFINETTIISEFSFRAVIVGLLLGAIFAAANVYVGMKAGLTISASIPVAVVAVAIFRALKKTTGESSILESNMAQTVGSAGESLAVKYNGSNYR